MKTAEINRAVPAYFRAVKRDGLKTQYNIIRAALDDFLSERDDLHRVILLELLHEMKDSPEYAQSEKALALLTKAIESFKD